MADNRQTSFDFDFIEPEPEVNKPEIDEPELDELEIEQDPLSMIVMLMNSQVKTLMALIF